MGLKPVRAPVDRCRMGQIGRWQVRWSALSRRRRLGAIAAMALAAGLVGVAVESASGDGFPAPVVWRDHVLETTTTNTP